MDTLIIRGARQHNLKNITLELPKNTLMVFTGLSGSGKSSLAFDTIYAEGQRRYVESLSSYARQFLGIMDKPDVDSIIGLSPSISIDQKSASHNPRSTVGTVTEIYDYLRLLFARIGHPHCPVCGREISKQSPQQIVDQILKRAATLLHDPALQQYRFLILSPVVRDRKGEFSGLFENLKVKGYRQARVDGRVIDFDEDLLLIKTNNHTIDVVIDRVSIDRDTLKKSALISRVRSRITQSVEQALALSQGIVTLGDIEDAGFTIPDKPKHMKDQIFSDKFSCPVDNISLPEIEPRTFSFNSPHGACEACTGIGHILTVDPDLIISPELSITEGGILPFARMFLHDTWFSRVVIQVAKKYGMNERAPLASFTEKQKNILLYGTGSERHRILGKNRFGDQTTIEETYPGIVAELKRRYSESESDFMRGEIEKYMREEVCAMCHGMRLKQEALTITIGSRSITDITGLSITDCLEWAKLLLNSQISETEKTIATSIVKEIITRLTFLHSVGLEYLTLARTATTLSGGEAQRIRLASQIGSGLSGVLYVLDEPSIGLHQKDNIALINTLKTLRDLGNTVIVVEHDREMMEQADYIVDFGPGAGEHGGEIVAEGPLAKIISNKTSLTGQFLAGKRSIYRDRHARSTIDFKRSITVVGAEQNNLKKIDASFPLGVFTCVTGVSGSGKSSLIVDTLYFALFTHFNPFSKQKAGIHKQILGLEYIDKVILIDQSPIGRTPRSNPSTYIGMFSIIREIFATTSEARQRGYKIGRFSFNVRGGRCESCEGEGQKKIEMQFLSDVYVTCQVCKGLRYNDETLEVEYHGKNIAQILDMTVDEAFNFFSHYPAVREKLKTLGEVGLGYIHLGQPAPTLSGGEAQRVKLAHELSRRATGKTVYILDEPTTGLHFADLEKLLHVLHRLTVSGNTVIVIEHNMDIIKNADWIVDLGPIGGDGGGYIVAQGTPSDIAGNTKSSTGQILRMVLQ